MTQKEYIDECMKKLAKNIDEFSIGQTIIDVTDGSECLITNKTITSIEVFIKKKTSKGIDCTQWFAMSAYEMKQFDRRFKKA